MFFKKKPVVDTNPVPHQVFYAHGVYKRELYYASNKKFYQEYTNSIQNNEKHNLRSDIDNNMYRTLQKYYGQALVSYHQDGSETNALNLYVAANNLDRFREQKGFQYLSFTNYLATSPQSKTTIINFTESVEDLVSSEDIEVIKPLSGIPDSDGDDETEFFKPFRY